jgi:hypothetical protein
MSELKVNKVTPRSGTTVTLGDSGDTITVPSGATITNSGTATGFGKVLQVVQTVKSDTFTTTATTATDITGFSASITPSSASNKILVLVNLMSSSGTGMITGSHLLLRGATIIAGGDAAGTRATGFCSTGPWDGNWQGINGNAVYLDSPNTTSSTTYKIQVIKEASTYYLNRTGRDTDDAWHCRSASTILLLEIAG